MHSILLLLLIPTLCLLGLARPAAAGDPVVQAPVTGLACGETQIAEEAMISPMTAFGDAGPGLCEKLCKRGGKMCRRYVKDTFACFASQGADELFFNLTTCSLAAGSAEQERICKAGARTIASQVKADQKVIRDSEYGNCDAWATDCEAGCPNP